MNGTIRDAIVRELGLTGIPEDKLEELLVRAGQTIFQASLLRVVDSLPDAKQEEFAGMVETTAAPDPARAASLLAFIRANVPDFDEIVKQEVARFKEESAAVMGRLDA